jgi:pilus assembly protein Flp/PilA
MTPTLSHPREFRFLIPQSDGPKARSNMEPTIMTLSQIRRFILSEDGPTAVEYAVLVGLIAVALAASVPMLTNAMSTTFSSVSSTLTPASS